MKTALLDARLACTKGTMGVSSLVFDVREESRVTCAMFSSLAVLTCFCSMLHSQCKQYSPYAWECSKPMSRLHGNVLYYPGCTLGAKQEPELA